MRKTCAVFLGITTAAFLWSTLAAEGPVMTKIEKDGIVRIGHREASIPFFYLDNNRNAIGDSIDLCLEIVNEIKKEIGGKNTKLLYIKDIAEGLLAVKTDRANALANDDILLFGLIHKSGTPDEYKVIGRQIVQAYWRFHERTIPDGAGA